MKRTRTKTGAFIIAMSLILIGCANDAAAISVTKTIGGLPSSSAVQSSQINANTQDNTTEQSEAVSNSQKQNSESNHSSQSGSAPLQAEQKTSQSASVSNQPQPNANSNPKEESTKSTPESSGNAGAAGEFPIIEIPVPQAQTSGQTGQASSQAEQPPTPPTASTVKRDSLTDSNEVRGVWISYLEFLEMPEDISKAAFTQRIKQMFAKTADYNLNTVFVQVRPFGDALYRSQIFPWSYVLTGEEGKSPGYDPLAVMCEQARAYNLRIEAWINPYRIRATNTGKPISPQNPASGYINSGSDAVIRYNNGTYYNPASKTAQDLITAGVIEILQNYDVDGIHFDDYFYPTTSADFDKTYYNNYQRTGGKLDLAQWRRENVNILIRKVYAAVKKQKPDAIFGISPQARFENNYNAQFADVEKWVKNKGYIDYVCPQIYFGFDHETVPYAQLLKQWGSLTQGTAVDLYIGLAAYKCGVTDNGAKSGSNEWVASSSMLKRMVDLSRKEENYKGFMIYRYASFFEPSSAVAGHIARERSNLSMILG